MIGRLLGHSKVGTTARYGHLVHDAEKAAAARTGDSIGAHLVHDAEKAAAARTGDSIGAHLVPQAAEAA